MNDWLDQAVRRGRLQEFAAFGWDPSEIPDPIARSTFEPARLRWSEVASGDAGSRGDVVVVPAAAAAAPGAPGAVAIPDRLRSRSTSTTNDGR